MANNSRSTRLRIRREEERLASLNDGDDVYDNIVQFFDHRDFYIGVDTKAVTFKFPNFYKLHITFISQNKKIIA